MRFLATLNQPHEHYKDFMAQDWLEALYKKTEAVYVNGQLEKGEKEGTIHLQFYVNLPKQNRYRETAMKKFCPHTHWVAVGKDNGASTYCLKPETRIEGPWEFGEKPLHMNDSAENKRRRQITNAEILGGNLKELIDQEKVSLYSLPALTKALEQYNKLGQKEAEPLSDTCGIWIYGPKGVGKSHYARESLGYTTDQILNKNINKWFNDWNHLKHKVVLLDDYDHSHYHLGHYLKQWADKFPFQAETKGSTQFSIRPEKIIVTSNYTPDDIWPKQEDTTLLGAIKDRFRVIDASDW
jgi:hypothetical protein